MKDSNRSRVAQRNFLRRQGSRRYSRDRTRSCEKLSLNLCKDHLGLKFSFGEKKEQEESDLARMRRVDLSLLNLRPSRHPFSSYLQPFLIMSVIPFGLIGATLGHYLFGLPLSQLSHFGLVALTGVVINDSLVLVHYVNERAKGTFSTRCSQNCGDGSVSSNLTYSLTTFVGLMPILFGEKSPGRNFLNPWRLRLGLG